MLVVIPESVSSITSPGELFVLDGDTNEEFEACKHTTIMTSITTTNS